MSEARRLADLRAPEVAGALTESSVLVLPVGAIEQHGPHLPLNTDLVIAEAIAERAVAAASETHDVWLLPSLAYSKSNEHLWAAGTISLGATTLLSVLDDLGASIARLPTKRLAFLNGHGGNTQLLAVANRELRVAHGLMTFLLHPSVPRDSGGTATDDAELGMGVHGGRDETSVMLALRPDLVRMELAERWVPEEMAQRTHVRFGGSVPFGWLSDDIHPAGVVGDATLASAELGEQRVASMVGNVAAALAEVAEFRFPGA